VPLSGRAPGAGGKYLEEQTLRLPSWAWPDDESDTGISDDISFGASSD
jgi:hypothetical protein